MSGLLAAATASAQPVIVSPAPSEIALTIYRDDLALIIETRRVDVPAGVSTIAFEGVNERIIPQSALLAEFGAIAIERNFDFDLITPAAFFEKSVGRSVVLTRTNLATGTVTRKSAKIVSAGGAQGVVLEIDGGFEAYQCSGLPEAISAAALPENLKAKPTLSLTVSAEDAGPQELTISYLASGFGWQADYVLNLEGETQAGLLGWLTVTNDTASGIENAETAIVAGELQRLGETRSEPIEGDPFWARCWPRGSTKTGIWRRERVAASPPASAKMMSRPMMAAEGAADEDEMIVVTGSRIARREELGDYKLYRTPEPTTVAAYQTKQVVFLEAGDVAVEKRYVFEFDTPEYFAVDEPEPANVEYRIDNSREGTLGVPLPAGTYRAFTARGEGSAFFLGEDYVEDRAVGLPVKPRVAYSPDVQIETRILKREEKSLKGGVTRYRMTVEHVVTNASPQSALVEIAGGRGLGGALKIEKASIRTLKTESLPTWLVTLAPETSQTLSYRATWVE
jgi:hypothetical protein